MELDPIALIMHALKFGAAGIAAGPLNQKGIELWNGFNTAIKSIFAGQPKAQIVFAEYEDDPDVWVEPLKKMLIVVKADQDKKILALARKLKALEEAQQPTHTIKQQINNLDKVEKQIIAETISTLTIK